MPSSRLRALWIRVQASYWFLPSIFTLSAFLLAIATIEVDRHGWSEFLNRVEWLHSSRPQGALTQLSVIAGAMISVAATVFAVTMAAVAFASGNYGPRLLTNFMNDRGNQVSLAVFIATFVYNLMVLRVVREGEEAATAATVGATALPGFVPQLSLLVSTASVIVAVAILVFFLHHVPASIRINSVLAGIGRRLLEGIDERFPNENGDAEPWERPSGQPVDCRGTGYIEIIDFEGLGEFAREKDLVITLDVRPGDFVHPGLSVARIAEGPCDEKIRDAIRSAFSLGSARTAAQDLEYLFDELVEIGDRALSPGINDPFTAITAMHWMGAALSSLAQRDLVCGPEQERYDRDRVRPLPDGFEHFLHRSFGSIRYSASGNALAARVFLDALAGVACGSTSERRRRLLVEEASTMVRQAEVKLGGPALEELQAKLDSFEEDVAAKRCR